MENYMSNIDKLLEKLISEGPGADVEQEMPGKGNVLDMALRALGINNLTKAKDVLSGWLSEHGGLSVPKFVAKYKDAQALAAAIKALKAPLPYDPKAVARR
jgi:hypothetical protein